MYYLLYLLFRHRGVMLLILGLTLLGEEFLGETSVLREGLLSRRFPRHLRRMVDLMRIGQALQFGRYRYARWLVAGHRRSWHGREVRL
jgi:hypothetical protein